MERPKPINAPPATDVGPWESADGTGTGVDDVAGGGSVGVFGDAVGVRASDGRGVLDEDIEVVGCGDAGGVGDDDRDGIEDIGGAVLSRGRVGVGDDTGSRVEAGQGEGAFTGIDDDRGGTEVAQLSRGDRSAADVEGAEAIGGGDGESAIDRGCGLDRLLMSLSLPAMTPLAWSIPAWRKVDASVPSPMMSWSLSAAPGSMMVRV